MWRRERWGCRRSQCKLKKSFNHSGLDINPIDVALVKIARDKASSCIREIGNIVQKGSIMVGLVYINLMSGPCAMGLSVNLPKMTRAFVNSIFKGGVIPNPLFLNVRNQPTTKIPMMSESYRVAFAQVFTKTSLEGSLPNFQKGVW